MINKTNITKIMLKTVTLEAVGFIENVKRTS